MSDESDRIAALSDDLASCRRALRRQEINYSTLLEIANKVNASGLDLSRVERYVRTMSRGQFGVVDVFLARAEIGGEDGLLKMTMPSPDALGGLTVHAEEPFGRWCCEQAVPVTREQLRATGLPEGQTLADGAAVLVPLVNKTRARADLVGLLAFGDRLTGQPFGDGDLELLRVVSSMLAVALDNARLYHSSIVDSLTQVYSRGHFDAQLVQELSRCRRHRRQLEIAGDSNADSTKLSLVMVDIDHFKRINDTHGHPTGDAVLRTVGSMLRSTLRAMDIVSRYGGEEFALVLPETPTDGAQLVAERLRERFHELGCLSTAGEPVPITASFGVATWPDHADDMRELVAGADRALYRAKDGGRDRVEVAR